MINGALIAASKSPAQLLTRQIICLMPSGASLLLTLAVLLFSTGQASANAPDGDPPRPVEIQSNPQQETTKEKVSVDSVEIHICRPKSFMRMGDAPDIRISGNKVGEIGRGDNLKFEGKINDDLTLINNKNFIKYRFKDDLLLSTKIPPTPLYIVVKPLGNFAQAATIFFGRAIAEAIRQDATTGDSGNWSISILDSKDFVAQCAE